MIEYTARPKYRPSRITEADLLGTLSGREEARPCACGGVIIADPINPMDGVSRHQGTDQHREWSEGVYG